VKHLGFDEDGTLDEFIADNVQSVHFEAMDAAEWWMAITLGNGEVWHLNFGAKNPRAKGYANAELVIEQP
jgi:hypothetical protein